MRIDVPVIGEFIDQHGGNPIRKPGSSHTYLLPDGSCYRQIDDGRGTNVCHEPPDDPIERCKIRRLYHATAYEQVRRDFRQLRGALKGLADQNGFPISFRWPENRYGPDPQDASIALRTLYALVVKHHAHLAVLDTEFRKLTARPEHNDEPIERPYVDQRLQDALAETSLDYIDV